MLYLPPTIATLAGEIQADERERRTNRARVRSNVLCGVDVHLQLVDEGALPVSSQEGVGV